MHINNQSSDYSPRFRWIVLIIAIFSMGVFTIAFQTIPVIIPQLKTDFAISTAEAGLLMAIAVFPGIFLSLPSGWFFNKYHARKAGMLASGTIAIACILLSLSTSYQSLLAGRFILGLGGNLMHVTCLAMVSQWFGKDSLGKAMGIYMTSASLMTIGTYSGISLLSGIFDWRLIFCLCLILAVISSGLFLSVMRNTPTYAVEIGVDSKKNLLNKDLWKIGIVFLCTEVATGSFFMWAPTLFTQFTDMSIVESSLLDSLSILPTIFLLPLFGFLSDRTGKRRFFIILGSLLMTLAFIGLASSSYLTTVAMMSLALFMGVTSTMIAPALNTLPQELLGYGKTGIGFGVLAICGAISGVLASILIGYLIDVSNVLFLPLLSMAAFAGVATVVALTLKTK